MRHDVFISYSSKDRTVADAVCAALESDGCGCWLAPRNILPGQQWSEAIIDALNTCRAVVLIFSSHANASPQVLREVERAVSKQLPLIPFRIEDVALSKTMEYFISVPHWLNALDPPLEPHLETLVRTVRGLLHSGPAAALAAPALAPSAAPTPVEAPPAGNLPRPVTTFVGREAEVAAVTASLDSGARLVTLTGAGGCGKTRIALRVATDGAARFPGGAWWVDLAPLRDAEQVPWTIAASLGLKEDPQVPVLQQLAQRLQSAPTLLVLDNFEQVIPAAADLGELIRLCPSLTVLVSSRAVLNLSFEHEYAVAGLGAEDAVALFGLRAQQARASFALDAKTRPVVERLCRKLDGIPLAVELAAAQVRLLTVAQIEKQLTQRFRSLVSPFGDVVQRQRTLRAAVDWSYELLSEEERVCFAALSVCVASFTLEAAEAVTGSEDAFAGVVRLREQSLLQSSDRNGAIRFSMIETLREYGLEKLREGGTTEAVAERHARFYAGMAQQEGTRILDGDAEEATSLLAADIENVRAALEWLLAHGEIDEAAALGSALSGFWERQGRVHDGRELVTRCLAAEDAIRDAVSRARLLAVAGWFAHLQADYAAAEEYQRRSLALCREAGDAEGEANALNNLAVTAQAQGRVAEAREALEASLKLAGALGDIRKQAARWSNLGMLATQEGELEEAQEYLQTAHALFLQAGDRHGAAACLCNQSDLALQRGAWEDADFLSQESLDQFREIDDIHGVAYALANRAEAATGLGAHAEALDHVLEALAICLKTGMHWLAPALLEIFARNQAARGSERDALFHLTAASHLRERMRAPRSAQQQDAAQRLEASLAASLGEALVRSLRLRATTLPLEAVVSGALASVQNEACVA